MYHKFMNPSTIHRALIIQGGGSLGAYEAGAYKAIHEAVSRSFRAEGKKKTSQYFILCLELR